jgi:dihydrofolate synthase/folylpolyglutamate synthase
MIRRFDKIDKDIDLDLERIKYIMDKAGNPQNRFYSVLIGGTNGKGSVAALLTLLMEEKGLRVGLYTSPHMKNPAERVRICGETVDETTLLSLGNEIDSLAKKVGVELTPFESFTATAFMAFAREKVDWVVAEVGMGGRLDATNILDARLPVITSVGLDHKEWLGTTISQVAMEKAGIIKRGRPVIVGDLSPEALEVIRSVAKERKAELHCYGEMFYGRVTKFSLEGMNFFYFSEDLPEPIENLRIRTVGDHFVHNAALALRAFEVLTGEPLGQQRSLLDEALGGFGLPGRGQVVTFEERVRILDVAHNPEGIVSLCRTISRLFPSAPPLVIFSLLKDKEWESMTSVLLKELGRENLIFLSLDEERIIDRERMSEIFRIEVCDRERFEEIMLFLDRPIVVCGCFAAVREALSVLEGSGRVLNWS